MRMSKRWYKSRPKTICDEKKRRIWILGTITAFSANKITQFLDTLSALPDPIEIIISSCGGNFFPALSIYQKIKNLQYQKTRTIGFGQINSSAFLIFQAGDERVASQNASFLFHQATDEIKPDKDEELNSEFYYEKAKTLNKTDAIQFMVFTLRGRPISKIFDLFYHNAGLTAREAKKLKLVDKIISSQKVPRFKKSKGHK